MTSNYLNLITETIGSIGVLKINRPKQLNALNMETLIELERAVTEFDHQTNIRVIVITGEGEKAFVAGADIAAMREMTPTQADEFAHQGHRTMNTIEQASKPVIACVNGYALGGGTELALACDILYASDKATFGLPETKLSLLPGFGGTQRMPRLIGVARAKELIFTGKTLSAQEAYELGIVNKVIAHAELPSAVRSLAETIAANSPGAIRLAKKVINQGNNLSFQAALEYERTQFEELFATQDCKEGLAAFLEKRKPEFKGA
ncbi:MAG: hypothetical protein A3I05_07240 [Deltaproteobacteria bacterium RIFCSPLOWO2_02_FULL_44_10]|nr:MAG: hypothetical protein A3C46_04220 [Deltaproteobacteria bacterium RIFCSPHIGHO2_02_FULL_44_16]OGQ46386.1 MAG: hypothetical protein A3I05_07240 [Deltaproteobacteria bacterium RIFCSPLOWO2_02_FULL_44_10]